MPRPDVLHCEKKGEFSVAVIGIRMIVTPLPVFGLFFSGCLFEVMFLPVIFLEIKTSAFVLIVVPVVIVLVISIVNADLDCRVLGRRSGQH